MPNPYRLLLRIAETNITYLMEILHHHKQRLRSEAHAAISATETASAPNTSIPDTMYTLDPEAPVSYTPEELSIFLLTTSQSDLTSE